MSYTIKYINIILLSPGLVSLHVTTIYNVSYIIFFSFVIIIGVVGWSSLFPFYTTPILFYNSSSYYFKSRF